MLSTDQSHLRKYLATLGVAVVAGVVSVSALVLRLQDDLLVKESELAQLTPLARETIERRQHFAEVATTMLPWFFVVGLACGLGLSGFGIWGWARRQCVADRREDRYDRREEWEFSTLSAAEQHQRREREVELAAPVPAEPRTSGSRTPLRSEEVHRKVLDLENSLREKLVALYGTENVDANVRVSGRGGTAEFDAFVLSADRRKAYAVELRYISGSSDVLRRAREAKAALAAAIARVQVDHGIAIVVVNDDADIPERWRFRRTDDADSRVDIHLFHESEFLGMSPYELQGRLGIRS